jgi:hypothetical protein
MTESHTPAEKLYLAYPTSKPNIATFDIKAQERKQFLNTSFRFNVIGNSHCITAESIGFCEILSCEPIDVDVLRTIPLNKTTEEQNKYKINGRNVSVTIKGKPLSTFPNPETQDISYKFAEDAYTTITTLSESVYETYHTYPEYDLALYTKNVFTK